MSDTPNGGRDRSYRALVESEELHRATIENISDAVFLTDDDGAFTWICPNVDVIFGYVPDEVQAMGRIGALLGDGLIDLQDLKTRGEITNVERDIRSKRGAVRHLLIHIKQVAIQQSTVLYTCRDITERKHAEEELRIARLDLAQSSRLALVGQLVASIAHEVNQPLTSIHVNASAGLRHLQVGTPRVALGDVLRDILNESRRAGDIIERVRSLASGRPLQRRDLDLNELAGGIVHLVAVEARRRGVTLRTELTPSLPLVLADLVSMQQVLLNLIVNAMDAMAELPASERHVQVRTRQFEGAVEVAVRDGGAGVPPDRLERLFEAFFTTKPGGLGLGLAIARSIVEAHQGQIWAENHADRGVTFHVSLPVAAVVPA